MPALIPPPARCIGLAGIGGLAEFLLFAAIITALLALLWFFSLLLCSISAARKCWWCFTGAGAPPIEGREAPELFPPRPRWDATSSARWCCSASWTFAAFFDPDLAASICLYGFSVSGMETLMLGDDNAIPMLVDVEPTLLPYRAGRDAEVLWRAFFDFAVRLTARRGKES